MSTAKKENKQKKMEAQTAEAKRELALMQEYKNKLMPLVMFLKKHKLTFKHARVGQNRIQYFRLDEYNKFKETNQQKIDSNPKIKELLNEIGAHDFFYFNRPEGMKNIKYPSELQPVAYSHSTTTPPPKFCSFKFDSTASRKTTVILGIIAVLLLVLFPIWPYIVKYAIWLISLWLLIFLVGLIVVRLLIYIFCVILGFNVWIFPNLFGQYGFVDSFKPFFYAERWEQNTFNVIIRISACIFVAYCGFLIYLDPNIISDNFQGTKDVINDVHDWGVSKIKNQVKFSERAITNLEDILNQTADVADIPDTQETQEAQDYQDIQTEKQEF